jgi:ribosomal protein L11 methyltransferase
MSDKSRTWPALDVVPAPDEPELLHATLADYHILAIDESMVDRWRIFFSENVERDRAAHAVSTAFPKLSTSAIDIPDEDWAARSQANLRAIRVGKIIVAPPWDAPLTIVIKPSMGFGTGHHATTRLCLDALQQIELSDRTVLDVGTGSGILAIASSLLGASDVTGVDDDEDAIRAAWDNLALNTGAVVSLVVGDVRKTDLTPADVVVANVTGALLISSATRIRKLISPRGRLILSGLLADEETDVMSAYRALSVERRSQDEDWVCLTLRGS